SSPMLPDVSTAKMISAGRITVVSTAVTPVLAQFSVTLVSTLPASMGTVATGSLSVGVSRIGVSISSGTWGPSVVSPVASGDVTTGGGADGSPLVPFGPSSPS